MSDSLALMIEEGAMHYYENLSLAWNSSFWDQVNVVHVIANKHIDLEILDEATFDSLF